MVLVIALLAVPLLVVIELPRFFDLAGSVPPPSPVPPLVTATPAPTALPTPTGERIVIQNTGGLGAVLRSDPVTGKPVAALREQQVLDVLEHRDVPGSGDWIRVRTPEG